MSKLLIPAALIGLALGAGSAAPAQAGTAAAAETAPTPLDRFLERVHTLRVGFHQTLTDAHGALLSRSAGSLLVQRPGKFRWDIRPIANGAGPTGAGQLMVCDGRNLWFYDRDLGQVTVQPVGAGLSATPAMLLSGTVDVRAHFTERSAGRREGLEWVYVEPRQAAAADFRSALFGFRNGTLEQMILEDTLGQVATITFEHIEINVPLAPSALTFTVPAGADVIGTPVR